MRKNNRVLIGYILFLAVVWVGLAVSFLHLNDRAVSNQRELFQMKLDDVIGDSMEQMDSMDYSLIEAFLSAKLRQNGFPDSFQWGLLCDGDEDFSFVTEGTDSKLLLDQGFQYNLLSISDDAAYLDELYIYFPDIEKRFHWDAVTSYILISFLLILILLCFISFFSILLRTRKINSFREHMVNNITHELKTPITSISLASQFLLDDSFEKDRSVEHTYLTMISDEAKVMQNLVEEVLTVFRNYSLQRNKEDVWIHKLIETVAKIYQLSLEECHGKIVFDFQASNDVVFGDPPHLANSFSNLIDNAIKYRDGSDLLITISTRNVGDSIEIRVADNGIGISKENQKLIFEPFTRLNTENEHYREGYGLGLNYVLNIVKYHKGKIKVESELGKGAVFILTLPLKQNKKN